MATQRSFIMIGVVLLGVLFEFGRRCSQTLKATPMSSTDHGGGKRRCGISLSYCDKGHSRPSRSAVLYRHDSIHDPVQAKRS